MRPPIFQDPHGAIPTGGRSAQGVKPFPPVGAYAGHKGESSAFWRGWTEEVIKVQDSEHPLRSLGYPLRTVTSPESDRDALEFGLRGNQGSNFCVPGINSAPLDTPMGLKRLILNFLGAAKRLLTTGTIDNQNYYCIVLTLSPLGLAAGRCSQARGGENDDSPRWPAHTGNSGNGQASSPGKHDALLRGCRGHRAHGPASLMH